MQDPEAAAGKFGFGVDNTIGGTPQPNGWMGDWVEFFRERRLWHQLRVRAGGVGKGWVGQGARSALQLRECMA